jgi:probable selenium-dependent hydroxylase accessory protein YqeC
MQQTPLFEAFAIREHDVFACAGAGGKTTICWRLWVECRAHGRFAVYTTTTHMLEPSLALDTALLLTTAPDPGQIRRLMKSVSRLALAASRLPDLLTDISNNPIAPTLPSKLAGLPPEQIDRLIVALPEITWLIEADGARGKWLKTPAEHEPVIPERASLVAVVSQVDAVGHPLDDTIGHRPEQIASVLNIKVGDPVNADHIARLLSAGLKGIPDTARAVAVLNQRDETRMRPEAAYVAQRLLAAGRYERVVAASLRAEVPVLQVFTA